MFEPHFGLRENPFSTSHDPRFVYPSPEHLEAVAHFRYGIQNREAFVLVTGEVGTGKTTAIYDLVSRLPQQTHIALINTSALNRLELLEEIARRFGVELPASPSKPALLTALELKLSAHVGHGEACILIVDEAQNLMHDLLEEIRLLSNLEDRGGHLLHICLVGQPELEEKLARPELRQLRQRISVKYRLKPLSYEETVRYVHHRLRVAGGDSAALFPPESCEAVHRMTHGIPREINIVAGQAMVNAFVEGARAVAPHHVRAVSDEFAFQSVLSVTLRPVTGPGEIAGSPPPPAYTPPGAYAPPPAYSPPSAYPPGPYAAPAQQAPPAPAPRSAQPGVAPHPAVSPESGNASPQASPARPAPTMSPPPSPVPPPNAVPVGEGTVPAPPAVTLVPTVPPATAPPTAAAAPVSTRTVSNWRERRPDPVPMPRATAQAMQPLEIDADEEAAELSSARPATADLEESRGRRTRLVGIATIIAALLIGAMVLYSTGIGERLFTGGQKSNGTQEERGATSATAGGVSATGSGGAIETQGSEGVTDAPAGSPGRAQTASPEAAATEPVAQVVRGTTTAPVVSPNTRAVYGLQVASFRTAGRSARVLNDLESATNLPGEVLEGETDGETWFRIVLGRFPDERRARESAEDLLRRSLIAEAILIPYTPRMP